MSSISVLDFGLEVSSNPSVQVSSISVATSIFELCYACPQAFVMCYVTCSLHSTSDGAFYRFGRCSTSISMGE